MPHLHRRLVDAAHRQRSTVGTPPEPAVAAHLLGGDEVGAAPTDRVGGTGVTGERPARTRPVGHPQLAPAHVRDLPAERVGSGVEHRPVDREVFDVAVAEIAREQIAAEREHRQRDVAVGGIRGDAAGAFSEALATRPLFGGQFDVVGGDPTDQLDGIGDQRLPTGGDVGDPQAVDRIVTGPAARRTRLGRRPVTP